MQLLMRHLKLRLLQALRHRCCSRQRDPDDGFQPTLCDQPLAGCRGVDAVINPAFGMRTSNGVKGILQWHQGRAGDEHTSTDKRLQWCDVRAQGVTIGANRQSEGLHQHHPTRGQGRRLTFPPFG